jgi:two-component system, NarL family, invasion response regulator UvrY
VIKILVADDHPIVRRGLVNILTPFPEMTVVCEAGTGEEVLEMVSTHELDIVILDIFLPDQSGFEVLEKIKKDHPGLPVLLITAASENVYFLKSMKAGASGFVNKEAPPEELVSAIRNIMRKGNYVSDNQVDNIISNLKKETDKPLHSRLSRQEFQVLTLIASGRSLTEIGKELNLNVKTIGTYKARILKKMNMRNNAELLRYCLDEKIIL